MVGGESSVPLPPRVQSLFWDTGRRDVSLEREGDFVIGRVLSAGDWESVLWLRSATGDASLRDYVIRTRGRLLSPRQLRLWQVLLDLPQESVDQWLAAPERRVWDRRAG
jgi:hypothetical protein